MNTLTSTASTTRAGTQTSTSNWFDHTDFNELEITWGVGTNSGALAANIAPHADGILVVPARAWQDDDVVHLRFTVNGVAVAGTFDQKGEVPADLTLNDGTANRNFALLGTYTVGAGGTMTVVLDSSDGSGDEEWTAVDAVAFRSATGGADPVPAEDLVITGPVAGNMGLSWTGIAGNSYGVQTNIDLVIGEWGTLMTGIPGIDGTIITNTPVGPVGPDQTFYRVITE